MEADLICTNKVPPRASWEPHVSLLYFARTLETYRQEVGWWDGGRRTLLPVKRQSLSGLLSEFSFDFLWRQTICNHRRVSVSLFLSRKRFPFSVFVTIMKISSFFFSPSYFFFLSENQFSDRSFHQLIRIGILSLRLNQPRNSFGIWFSPRRE